MRTIGEKIHFYRKRRGYTRKKLVDGICNESTLFRIEKGDVFPSMFLLEQLCHKLSIPIAFVLDKEHSEIQKLIVFLKQQCRKHVYDKNYSKLSDTLDQLQTLLKMADRKCDSDQLFLIWHNAILLHKKDNNSLQAKKLLQQSLSPHPVIEIEIAMMNTLGLICVSLGDCEEAYHYFQQAYMAVESLPSLNDITLFIRVGYNYTSRLFYLEKYENVIQLIKQMILYQKIHHLLYMKGRTLHMLAKTYEKIGDNQLAENYMKDAIAIFTLEDNQVYLEKAIEDLETIRLHLTT